MTWSPWMDRRVRASALAALIMVLLMLNEARLALREAQIVPVAPRAAIVPKPSTGTAHERAELGALFGVASGVSTAEANTAPATFVPPLRLIGTVAGTDEPSALCQLGADAPRILHLGDTLGGWRLQHIAPAVAVFIDAAGVRHELRLSPSGN